MISTLKLRCLAISKHPTQDQKCKKVDQTDLQSDSREESVLESQVSYDTEGASPWEGMNWGEGHQND